MKDEQSLCSIGFMESPVQKKGVSNTNLAVTNFLHIFNDSIYQVSSYTIHLIYTQCGCYNSDCTVIIYICTDVQPYYKTLPSLPLEVSLNGQDTSSWDITQFLTKKVSISKSQQTHYVGMVRTHNTSLYHNWKKIGNVQYSIVQYSIVMFEKSHKSACACPTFQGHLQSLDWTGGLDWWTGLAD